MQVTVKKNDLVLYHQVLDDSTTLNNTVAALMQQPQGDLFTTAVENNGHTLTFKTNTLDVVRLIRSANGIITKTRKAN